MPTPWYASIMWLDSTLITVRDVCSIRYAQNPSLRSTKWIIWCRKSYWYISLIFTFIYKTFQIICDCFILLFSSFVLSTCVIKLIFNKMYLYQQNDITNYGLFLNHCIFTLFYFTAKHIFKWIFYFSCAVIIVLPIW